MSYFKTKKKKHNKKIKKNVIRNMKNLCSINIK